MADDILPGLLAEVQAEFERSYGKSAVVGEAFEALTAKQATYQTVNALAVEVGEILAEVLRGSVNSSVLPDGQMYYNIANRLLGGVLVRNHELIAGYAGDVQKLLNDQAKIGLKVQVPEFNQDRLDGLVNRLDSEGNFDDVSWLLQEPIVNFSQSIVDDSIRKNAEFHAKAGLTPTISRQSTGKCCKWCDSLDGQYIYGEEPPNFYRRHGHCKCTIDYHPKDGRKQNSWSKKWTKESQDVLELRKQMNIDVRDNNRKADIAEYKKIVEILGPQKAPISLAKFQKLKYNDGEGYEQLKDKLFIYEKIKSGEWGTKINSDKQLPHTESKHLPGKSYIYDSVDIQKLFDENYGNGMLERDRHGRPTNKEIINLTDPIGVNASDGSEVTSFKIHHSQNRTHIVPRKGEK